MSAARARVQISRRLRGLDLRARASLVFVGGAIACAFAYYVLLLTMSGRFLDDELEKRSLVLVSGFAEDAAMPMLVGDAEQLTAVCRRLTAETDIVSASIFDAEGVLRWSADRSTRTNAGAGERRTSAAESAPVRVFEAPVRRAAVDRALDGLEDGLPRPGGDGNASTIGRVRIEVSTARQQATLRGTARVGLLLLAIGLVIGLGGAWTFVRVLVRPLREAGDLAHDIANGNLDRRLPVRQDDELGALASSMNLMAQTLQESLARERAEAETMRHVAEAVLDVSRGARASYDPRSVFKVVAAQIRRIAECRSLALAVRDGLEGPFVFCYSDPSSAEPLFRDHSMLAPDLAEICLRTGEPYEFDPRLRSDDLSRALAEDGVGWASLVPMALGGGVSAMLLVTAGRQRAPRREELRLVAALTGHVTASIQSQQLRVRLEKAFEELQATRDQLLRSERLRATGELASGVAHDFNNVLGAILGRVQLVRRQMDRGERDLAGLGESLGVIEIAARDGAETVRRLRQFSIGESPAAGGTAVDLPSVVREAVELTRPRWKHEAEAEGREISVVTSLRDGTWVTGRANELREALVNLILNAADAMPQGGVIRIGVTPADGEVALVVEDNGTGMDEETRKRMFDPFFTTKGARGTGLGMSMIYGIVQRAGGRIDVRSALGIGTVVDVYLRRSEPPSEAPAETPIEPAAPLQRLRVLVVDDEDIVRELLRDILTDLGHEVEDHPGAEEALAQFETGAYDLVLTDLGMPGVSGWDVARVIRQRDRHVVIAFVTGWGDEVHPNAMREAGADHVVPKPFSIEDLVEVLQLAAARRLARAA